MATDIPEGYGLISGRSRPTAQAALAAADAVGLDASAVSTTDDGYLVPEKVLAEYEKALKKDSEKDSDDSKKKSDPAPAKKTPARSTTKKGS